jgi:hypothetical protein
MVGFTLGAFAVLVALGALAVPNGQFWGILLLAVGAGFVIGAPKQAIEVMNSGGGRIDFPVSFFERGRTFEFANAVSDALAGNGRGSRSERRIEQSTDAADPEKALRTLDQLRKQGLITEAEYASRREAVLARL